MEFNLHQDPEKNSHIVKIYINYTDLNINH